MQKRLKKLNRRQFIGVVGAGAVVAGCGAEETLGPVDPGLGIDPSTGGGTNVIDPIDPVDPVEPVEPIDPVTELPAGFKATFLHRITYGPTKEEQARYDEIGYAAFLDEQLNPAQIADDDDGIGQQLAPLWTLSATNDELMTTRWPDSWGQALPHQAKAKLIRAVKSKRQLYERMVDFWMDHFNVQAAVAPYVRFQHIRYEAQAIRPHALGNFRDLLFAVAKSPAMMEYLDNQANIRNLMNENYARELFELHTVGLNNGYTHQDITETARAFTGWRAEQQSGTDVFNFQFRADYHDNNSKRVMGLTLPAGGGITDGEQILDFLASHPNTATSIATKLIKRFVTTTPAQWMIDRVANAFYDSDGDIKTTMREVLSVEILQNAETQLRRPLDMIANMLRRTNASIDSTLAIDTPLRTMGHYPYDWSTPDGYPTDKSFWVGGLLGRWNFAFSLAKGQVSGFSLPSAAMLGPGVSSTVEQVIDHWNDVYLTGTMTAAERQALIDYSRNVRGGSAAGDAELFAMMLTLPSGQMM